MTDAVQAPEPVDLLAQLRSTAETLVAIADGLEERVGRCGARRKDTALTCALSPRHRGYHVPADGGEMWLDD